MSVRCASDCGILGKIHATGVAVDIEFNGGDEVRQPFLLATSAGAIDLTGCSVSALVTWGTGQMSFSPVIDDTSPDPNQPHGTLILSELDTMQMPQGKCSKLRFIVVNAQGVTQSTTETWLNRLV